MRCSRLDIVPLCCCSTEISEKINLRLFTVDEKEPDLEVEGQDHVFTFWRHLKQPQKDELDKDFDALQHEFGLNLELLKDDFRQAQRNEFLRKMSSSLTLVRPRIMDWELKRPPGLEHGANLTKLPNVPWKRRQIWQNMGFEMYAKGRVAIVILSGGLDAGLGEGVPTGALDFGLISAKSIFQLYAERIDRLQTLVHKKKQCEVCVPLYIMCNRANISFISDFFEENNYFGLRDRDVMFFEQLDYPSIDHKGKLLLGEKHKIIQSPSGNGAVFRALIEEGMYADMKMRGVNCMYVCSIDNMLAKVGDPVFLGYCDNCLAECGVKCITKELGENIGSYCSKVMKTWEDRDGDGKRDLVVTVKPAIYEPSEMDEELLNQKEKNDVHSLAFNAGNLSQYFFKLDFVKRVCTKMDRTWHLVHQRLSHFDLKTWRKIEMTETSDCNGYRMETWIFDSFHFSTHVAGLMVPRDEYAVIKQKLGLQSPATALRAVSLLHQSWILKAGGTFLEEKSGSERHDEKCEISPLVSYDGEGLDGHFIVPLQLPYYLPSKVEDSDLVAVKSIAVPRTSLHFVRDDCTVEAIEREREINSARENENTAPGYLGERARDKDEVLPPTPRDFDRRNSLAMGDRRNSLVMGDRRNSLVGMGMGDRRNSLVGMGMGDRRGSLAMATDMGMEDMIAFDDGDNDLSTCRTGRSSRRSARLGTGRLPIVRTSSRDAFSARRSMVDEEDDGIPRMKSIDDVCPNMKEDNSTDHSPKVELYDREKIEMQRVLSAGDDSARVSILSGWSHASIHGEIFEELETGFGHIVGTAGVPNTGKGTVVYNNSARFWTPGKHRFNDDSDDYIF